MIILDCKHLDRRFPLIFKGRQSFFIVGVLSLVSLMVACSDRSTSTLQSTDKNQADVNIQPVTPSPELTLESLEKAGAIQLNNEEILELIVDHSIVFEHLGTGEYFEAIYKKDGRRLLTSVDSGGLDDATLEDNYLVKNNKLNTEFKGTPISSAIFKLGQRYLAAAHDDRGIVNYEIRDIVTTPLTVDVLKSQNAKVLSNEEIKSLFVGKKILIKDLSSGDEYLGYYGDDGIRTLEYNFTDPKTNTSMQQSTKDSYQILNNQLHSTLDGNKIESTIIKLGAQYYGALNIDDGAINYEFIPQ